jgi:hypothetical protein
MRTRSRLVRAFSIIAIGMSALFSNRAPAEPPGTYPCGVCDFFISCPTMDQMEYLCQMVCGGGVGFTCDDDCQEIYHIGFNCW